MGAVLVPFDASNLFGGLHESLYADHYTLSSLMAVMTAAVWSHLWHYPDNLSGLLNTWRAVDASYLQLFIPFLVPLALWFGLDRFLRQSENAFRAINHIVTFEKGKLSSSYDDPELKQCLELMRKNRRDYEEVLRLCDQFPGQREKADLDRLKRARKKTGSGDVMRIRCPPMDFSDSTDTDWTGKHPAAEPILDSDSDSDRTFPGYTDDDDDDAVRLNEAEAASEAPRPSARPRTKNCNCDY